MFFFAGRNVLPRYLGLSLRNFFNEDPGHRLPACVGVARFFTRTITNPESHSHLSFVDVVTVPLNMADSVKTLSVALPHVHYTVNGQGSWTLCAVESEVPAFATACTLVDSKGTSPGHMKSGVRKVLGEHTVLNLGKMKANHLVINRRWDKSRNDDGISYQIKDLNLKDLPLLNRCLCHRLIYSMRTLSSS